MSELRLQNLTIRYGKVLALDGLDLVIKDGELVTLLGPSGCGKTTTLRSVSGFLSPQSGDIFIGERRVTDIPPERRGIGLVFQNYALFPHMTVAQNVGFGLAMQRVPKADRQARADRALATVQLDGYGRRKPSELSGGQQQRVALARAIVTEPDILLLDEPLSNLDARLREDMRAELLDLQRRVGITTVLVTHDIHEAFALSDRVAVMRAGKVEQLGAPTELYDRPANRFVASFLGHVNEWPGKVARRDGGYAEIRADGLGDIRVACGDHCRPGQDAWIMLRPERMRLVAAEAGGAGLAGRIDQVAHLGNLVNYRVTVGGRPLAVQASPERGRSFVVGQDVRLTWNEADVTAVTE